VSAPVGLRLESAGPEDTAALGAALARMLRPGDLVLLRGELGTGKTTLVRAIAGALGVTGPVTSPTFTLSERYAGRHPIVHVDAYRLAGADPEDLGLLLEGAESAIALVEWPEALAGGLPPARIEVGLSHRGGEKRLVTLASSETRTRSELARLVADLRARHRHPEPRPGAPGGDRERPA
jgi:tRNA threonylcarbamoyladenosine biosynthesis protein TsaE